MATVYAAEWDKVGERYYEIGVDHGMFYPLVNGNYNNGEAWSGLSNVTNKPEGADVNDIWADNMKYLSIRAAEKFGATIECYSYPDGFKACNGEADLVPGVTISGQTRKPFGFSYRTRIGNDQEFQDYGYKIHLIYNATASPVEKSYGTINDSTDVDAMSYDVETTAVPVSIEGSDVDYKPTSHIEIDSTKVNATKLANFLKTLYGQVEYSEFSGSAWVEGTDYYTENADGTHSKVDTTKVTAPETGVTYYTMTVTSAPSMPGPAQVYSTFATQG